MSLLINSDGVSVYKFKTSGLVALCEEVTDYVRSGDFDKDNLDIHSATFEEGKYAFYVHFKDNK